ncbi:MAG: hypothetical protein ACFFG0_00100 [Candidatus Thorarchaeota archaeon]
MLYLFLVIILICSFLMGADFAAYKVLSKAIPKFKNNSKTIIPGYSLYVYLKWRKEIKP